MKKDANWNRQNVSNMFQKVPSTVIIIQGKSMHNLLPIDQVPSHSPLLFEGATFAMAQITWPNIVRLPSRRAVQDGKNTIGASQPGARKVEG